RDMRVRACYQAKMTVLLQRLINDKTAGSSRLSTWLPAACTRLLQIQIFYGLRDYGGWQRNITVPDNHFLTLLGKNHFQKFCLHWIKFAVRMLVDVHE